VKICASFLDRVPRVNFDFLDLAMQNTFAPSLPTALLNAFHTNNRINHLSHRPSSCGRLEGKPA
jgi:hypothetical protein